MNVKQCASLLLRAADCLETALIDNRERHPSYAGIWFGLLMAARALEGNTLALQVLDQIIAGNYQLTGMDDIARQWRQQHPKPD